MSSGASADVLQKLAKIEQQNAKIEQQNVLQLQQNAQIQSMMAAMSLQGERSPLSPTPTEGSMNQYLREQAVWAQEHEPWWNPSNVAVKLMSAQHSPSSNCMLRRYLFPKPLLVFFAIFLCAQT
jgi:hypothetical protein